MKTPDLLHRHGSADKPHLRTSRLALATVNMKMMKRLICLATSSVILTLGCDSKREKSEDQLSMRGQNHEELYAQSLFQEKLRLLEIAGANIEHENGRVKSLVFDQGEPITDVVVNLIADCFELKRLRFTKASIEQRDWLILTELPKLQHLDLRGSDLPKGVLKAFCEKCPDLRSIRLNGKSAEISVDDETWRAVATLKNLKLLAADFTEFDDSSATTLSNSNLEELYIAGTNLTDAALQELSALRKLKKLRIAGTNINKVDPLVDLALQDLDLSECKKLDTDCVKLIANMTSLQKLNLYDTSLMDGDLSALGKLPELRWLNLDKTGVGDEAVNSLATLRAIEFLHLGSTQVTNASMPAVAELSTLRTLVVTRTQVTSEGLQSVTERLPDLEIQLQPDEG